MRHLRFSKIFALLCTSLLLLSVACDEEDEGGIPPPEAPAAEVETGRIVWHDLVTPDPGGSVRFYGGLLGWSFSPGGGGQYQVASLGKKPVAVVFNNDAASLGDQPAVWVPYFATLAISATAKRVEEAGGTLVRGPLPMQGRGYTAIAKDPSGAVFGLVGAASTKPAGPGDWIWAEIGYDDRESVLSFYRQVVGLTATRNKSNPGADVLLAEDVPVAGAMPSPFENVPGLWTPFLEVENVARTVEKAEALGARVLIAPDAEFREGSIALIQDPQGGLFAIQQIPRESR